MDEWRWMGSNSLTILPAAQNPSVLRLNFSIPGELVSKPPVITVVLNGKTLERFRATSPEISRDYHVTPLGTPNVLQLSTDQMTKDATSGRDLGLRVRFISWGPG